MTMLNVANRAISTLASDISDTDTSLTVASGDGVKFPPSNFVVTIEDERILVGTRTDDTFSSLTRHYDNSTAVAHTTGTAVDLNVSAAVVNSLKSEINNKLDIPNVITKTAAYTATDSDAIILCDASSGAFTLTLPTAAERSGKSYTIKKTDSSANIVTIDGDGSETIDGELTQTLSAQDDSISVISDGTNWSII